MSYKENEKKQSFEKMKSVIAATGVGAMVGEHILQRINEQQKRAEEVKQVNTGFGQASIFDKKGKSNTTISSDDGFDKYNQKNTTPKNADELRNKFNLKENEVMNIDLGKYSNSKFIPQSVTKTLTGKAAGYALTKGDYFGAITFLCEGVYPKAFYHDPASGGRRGVLINTHPGITLSLQSDKTIRNIFSNTSLRGMTDEIIFKSLGPQSSRGVSPNMANSRLAVGDYYHMFQHIEGKYSKGAYDALAGRLKQHPMAKQLYAKGMDTGDIMERIQSNLPPASYSVLQQLSYKYGTGGIKRFGKLLDSTISAGLDTDNQEQHLANGARFIVYQYMNGKKQWVQDTRVMNIHRLFFTSGDRFSPELNLKLITGEKLNDNEQDLVAKVAKKAGVPSIVKDGKLELPNGTLDSMKSSVEPKLNQKAIDKGITTVNQNFKPIEIEVPKPKVEVDEPLKSVKQANKPAPVLVNDSCMTVECAMNMRRR